MPRRPKGKQPVLGSYLFRRFARAQALPPEGCGTQCGQPACPHQYGGVEPVDHGTEM